MISIMASSSLVVNVPRVIQHISINRFSSSRGHIGLSRRVLEESFPCYIVTGFLSFSTSVARRTYELGFVKR
jgi:hypothetical protein